MNREDPPPTLGRLRNGNPRGNPNAAPRCGACNRAGNPCRAPAMANGRCRRHGGKSTGPTTDDGVKRLRLARTVHGFYGIEGLALRESIAALRTQHRLLRLVNAPCHSQKFDPDHGEAAQTDTASDPCNPPT